MLQVPIDQIQHHHVNNRPVKCGLCQQVFPKSVIRTAITKKSILEVLKNFSRQTGLKSGHVQCDDDDDDDGDSYHRHSSDNEEKHKNHKNNSSRSPSPASSTHSFSSSPTTNNRNNSNKNSKKKKSPKNKGKNPTTTPSSIYAPAPICKFCAQFFGVYDVPLSEEQAATAIELGVPLLELTKGTKAPKKKNNNSPSLGRNRRRKSSQSVSPLKRNNSSNNIINNQDAKTPGGSVSPRFQQNQNQIQNEISSPNRILTRQQQQKVNSPNSLNEMHDRKMTTTNDAPAASPNSPPPLQRRATMSMSTIEAEPNNQLQQHHSIVTFEPIDHEDDNKNKINNNNNYHDLLHRQKTDDDSLTLDEHNNNNNNLSFETISKSKLFQKYNAGRSAMTASSRDLLTRKPGISTGGISYDQYLNNEATNENPTPPPSSSQAMKLASGLLKRELHKLQAARFRETISKIDAQTRAYLLNGETKDETNANAKHQQQMLHNSSSLRRNSVGNDDNNNNNEEQHGASSTTTTKGVRFDDEEKKKQQKRNSISVSKSQDKSKIKKQGEYDDDFENDDEDDKNNNSGDHFEVSSSDEEEDNVDFEHGKMKSEKKSSKNQEDEVQKSLLLPELNATQTPAQKSTSSIEIKNSQESVSVVAPAVTTQNDNNVNVVSSVDSANKNNFNNNSTANATTTIATTTPASRPEKRFQIAMDRVDNLVQHLLKSQGEKNQKSTSRKINADNHDYEHDGDFEIDKDEQQGVALNNMKSKELLLNTPSNNNNNKKNQRQNNHTFASSEGELTSPPSKNRTRRQLPASKEEKSEQQQADELVRAIANAKNARNNL